MGVRFRCCERWCLGMSATQAVKGSVRQYLKAELAEFLCCQTHAKVLGCPALPVD